MKRRVTAGLNGSPESLAAAHWAAEEAERRDLPLGLVYAGRWLPQSGPEPEQGPDLVCGWPHRMLRDVAADIVASHPRLPVSTDLVRRLPLDALLAALNESEVLVLGSRALGDINGFVFGSTAMGVLARAEKPVVLVRWDAPDSKAREKKSAFRGVVLGLDPTEECDALIEFAFDTAVRRRSGLRVIHTWRHLPSYDQVFDGTAPDTGIDAERTVRVSERLRPWRGKYPEVEVEEHCVKGRAASELVKASSAASLLIVGRNLRHAPLGPHIGPVTHAVIHHAVCPVAVVPYP